MCLTIKHPKAGPMMRQILEAYNVEATAPAMWEAMRYQDIVAAAAARLLVYTLPGALAATQDEGWNQYVSAWRPGKPHPESWPKNWMLAGAAVGVA
jgi:hypothetical protein